MNKQTAHYHLPVCLNSMNYTECSCRCFGNTGNIFTTGATLVPSTEHRRTVSGAAAASHWRITTQEKCWHCYRNTDLSSSDLQQFKAYRRTSFRQKMQ